MKLVVTGGAGFVGTHVVHAARALGHEVVVVDRLAPGPARPLPPDVHLIAEDVRHPRRIAARVGRADVVMHLAADASVPHGERAPLAMAEDNVAGTAGALELAEAVQARQFRFVSSAAVYGDPGPRLPLHEGAPLAPLSFYGWSKWAGEAWCRRFAETRGLALVIFRPANIYGPGQNSSGEGGVVARFAERLASGAPLVREGSGEQVRDYIHVRDVATALLHRLGDPVPPAGDADAWLFNVGSGVGVTVNALGAALAAIAQRPLVWEPAPPRPGDIFASVFDTARLTGWGFCPTVPLPEGLRETWEALGAR